MSQQWQTSRFLLQLDKPQVMGIVNVTPDSFSDGGRHAGVSQAMAHAELLLEQAEITAGAALSDPAAFVQRVNRLLSA